jgi:imidazolonepropionase-like amidohydrolase
MIEFISMPRPLMEEAARLGAYLEIVSGFTRTEEQIREHVEAIRRIGVEHFILSSDRGQANGPLHPDGLVMAAKALMSHGITEDQIDVMLKVNPAKLLGLPAAPTGR